ncbi:methenyltetrahydromethanopterin cyclohydrolase [Clostridium paraputrificum]|jgi:methenyltetrahydromethanopterin cyclohydrolase|uniref:methenyltetrahydromethanopterin cyclohydrolase n=1 Tax=Clostridium TaxID=1485 RepID=UPI00189C9066|nr:MULTISPECIES: methenyltetrahydromethanopterin cyclohydrolase [Clostridium]MDB2075830.1 methenyltetrahydromethanopterin cyclohydrolase [Clostridium paraputrificum]MDB2078806.1 methenyltetrahydromethanopterin cyclohydrolase [Clostridium paraputrificum]MDB2085622.1 methenyltetrahydromethanopterin cyclohydrolase [Clostridium paraputrificum]MDB2100749.1 methenyltetrahydromethanopterin cyclohydrolase [Clostridium paraputrificum]MDU1031985.1 methenyltetrahydromethanopterin cyclohydrolase [Clostrid
MISVNSRAVKLAKKLVSDPEGYKVKVHNVLGANVIDCGVEMPGSWRTAKLMTEILYGGLNEITYETFPEMIDGVYYNAVHVYSDNVVLQQAGCNISGWELKPGKYAPVLAGPGRTLARKKGDWFSKYSDYEDKHHEAVLTVEMGRMLEEEEVEELIEAVGVDACNLYILVAASGSIACSVQVSARIIEQTLHRLHEEKFNLDNIVEAHGFCVIPPVIKDDLIAMGRLNDVLIYGGQSTFTVDCEDEEVEKVIDKITSDKCSMYGSSFKTIYQENGCDFYRVPMEMYSPAKTVIINQRTGKVFKAGKLNLEILAKSFSDTK